MIRAILAIIVWRRVRNRPEPVQPEAPEIGVRGKATPPDPDPYGEDWGCNSIFGMG